MPRRFVGPALVVVSVLALLLLLPLAPAGGQSALAQPGITPIFITAIPVTAIPAPTRAVPAPTAIPIVPVPIANYTCTPYGSAARLCAWVTNPAPPQYTSVTVGARYSAAGQIVAGEPMTVTWHFESGTRTCMARTSNNGLASCGFNIGAAALDYRVNVDVNLPGAQVTTWFTPQFYCSAVEEIPSNECAALAALYKGTNGTGWGNKDGWLANNTPCSWWGVTCNQWHVTALHLAGNQLTGSIPRELGDLSSLDTLEVQSNALRGPLPQSLSNLAALQVFHFDTDALCLPNSAGLAAWYAGIADKSPGVTACKTGYFPKVTR